MRTDLGCGKTRQEKVAETQAEDRKEKVSRTLNTVSISPKPVKSNGMVIVRDTE